MTVSCSINTYMCIHLCTFAFEMARIENCGAAKFLFCFPHVCTTPNQQRTLYMYSKRSAVQATTSGVLGKQLLLLVFVLFCASLCAFSCRCRCLLFLSTPRDEWPFAFTSFVSFRPVVSFLLHLPLASHVSESVVLFSTKSSRSGSQ